VRTDEELMAAHVDGDKGAFRELFDRYGQRLFRMFRGDLRTDADAQDLVQQTFLQLHRARNDYKPGAKLKPWLFTIALNLKRELFRRRGRRPESELKLDGFRDPAEGPAGAARVDAAHTLKVALTALPDEQREVIELHWLGEMGFAEIAELTGVKLSTVKVRAHRGYKLMRQALEPPENVATSPSHPEGNRSSASGIP
jgi:RNA polymerase sigma-70 factor (ECF subfamily)